MSRRRESWGGMEHNPAGPTVENFPIGDVSPDLMRDAMTLDSAIWPGEGSLEQRIERCLREAQVESDVLSRIVWHVIRDERSVQAMASSYRRVVATESGWRFPVLALAGVCTDPEHRRQGLGRAIVRAAWARVDAEIPVCFFQTSLPAFYERMGARVFHNRIYDGTGARRAFWEPHAMIYPADAPWTAEAIDLQGGGW
jgi:predicted N-acetyltransferase YhbS